MKNHGTYVKKNSTDTCLTCHGPTLTGNDPIPGCTSVCHFDADGSKAPDGAGWVHAMTGHEDLKKYNAVCQNCHDVMNRYNAGPQGCHNCHAITPDHPLGKAWLDTDSTRFHGNSDSECNRCHYPETDCVQCHYGPEGDKVPPDSEWIHGNNAGHKDFESDPDVCNKCHEIDRSYDHPPETCHDCHKLEADHPTGRKWLDKNSSEFHGNSDSDCNACHYPETDCIQCHFGPDGDKVPQGSEWTHGNDTGHKDFKTDQDVCNKCHDLNRDYNNPPTSCHDCHAIEANHPLGKPWLDKNSSEFHGNSDSDCTACHYLETDCIQCHFGSEGAKAPPASGWAHGNNNGHKDFETDQAVCNQCHDLNRDYNNPPTSCHDCHAIEADHPLGKPWLDKDSSEFHGNSLSDCTACHYPETDCIQCHFGSEGAKAPPGSGWTHGKNKAHEDQAGFEGVCNKCHDLNRDYNHPPVSCHDCHAIEADHPLGQPWLDKNSSQFHGGSSSNCGGCHYLEIDCIQCHFGPDGDKSPQGSGWSHGNNNGHKSFESQQNVCNQCHELNRDYNNPPTSCHDCHDINHPLGQAWLDKNSSQFHGDSSLNCASCHSLSADCNSCHFGPDGDKAPQGSGWSHGNNNGHKSFESQQNVCNKCHELNRDYNNPPTSCHDCHDINHPLGQAWLDKNSSQFHGASSLNCASCHSLSADCNSCHFGPDGDKAPQGSGWSHGNNNGHKSFESQQNVCNKCHELNRDYNNPPTSCHDCHGDPGDD